MKKTKIFFFCPALIAGGLERVLSVLSGTLASHYDEVTYITWHDLPVFYDIDKRVKVVCAEKEIGSHSAWKRMKWLRQYVKSEQPDIFISFSTPFNMISLTALVGTGVKVVISERNDPAHFRWGRLAKMMRNVLYFKADGILVQTETSKKHLWKPLSKRATIVPNPLMIESDNLEVSVKVEKEHIILTASRLVPQKRNDLIIKAFSEFHKIHPNYKLFICGEGAERDRLKLLIKELDLANSVEMPGVIKNLREMMKVAEMFVMASEYEGMSNSLLEAMALGLPCISTKVSGAVDIIEDGENGLLIGSDTRSISKAISLLADDEPLRSKLGRNAVNIAGKYNISKVSALWLEYINRQIS